MHDARRYVIFTVILCILMLAKFQFTGESFAQTARFRGANLRRADWNPVIAADANGTFLSVSIDGRSFSNLDDGVYMDDDLKIMIPETMLRDAFDCSAHVYEKEQLVVEKTRCCSFSQIRIIISEMKKKRSGAVPLQKRKKAVAGCMSRWRYWHRNLNIPASGILKKIR